MRSRFASAVETSSAVHLPSPTSASAPTIERTCVCRNERADAVTSISSALRSRRPAWFDGRFVDTPVYDGDRLSRGHRIEGPAIVEERFTTLVLQPGHVAEVDRFGNYRVELP